MKKSYTLAQKRGHYYNKYWAAIAAGNDKGAAWFRGRLRKLGGGDLVPTVKTMQKHRFSTPAPPMLHKVKLAGLKRKLQYGRVIKKIKRSRRA